MPRIWLFSTDPEAYSFDTLLAKGREVWDGVKNALANRYLGEVRKGDLVLIYHTRADKCIVGLARAASDGRADPRDPAGRLRTVEIEPVRRLERPLALAELKASPRLRKMEFLRIPRLSVSPVTGAEWEEVRRMEKVPPP